MFQLRINKMSETLNNKMENTLEHSVVFFFSNYSAMDRFR